MSALDPAVEARLRDSFDRQGFMGHLGARLGALAPGRVAVEVGAAAHLTQQHGFFHAGVSASLADTAGGYAAFTMFAPDAAVLTTEFKLNLLAPAKGERLVATGAVVRHGRTLTVCDLEVHAWTAGAAVLVAKGLQTLIQLAGRPDDERRA